MYKSGPKDEFGNYRPIGLTSVFSRVVEQLAAKQIKHYLDLHQIWYPNQYGFRNGHNTQDMLLKYNERLFEAKQNGMHAVSLFIDVRKAFDCMSHSILVEKAAFYGLPAKWISSYLEGYKQYVTIAGHDSKLFDMDPIGTGQGRVLSPYFFGLFLCDLPCNTKLFCLNFADDTSFIACGKKYEELFIATQKELNKIEDWFLSNRLLLHPKKTRFIVYSQNQLCPDLFLGGEKVTQVGETQNERSFKLLGIEMDSNNTYTHHISKVTSKIQKAVSLINRSKNYLPYKMRLLIYNALVVSNINYCSVIWGNCSNQLKRLNKVQKRAIRVVTGSSYNAHTQPLFHKTGALKLEHLLELNILKLGNKIITKQSPKPVQMAFPLKGKSVTRSGDKILFEIPKIKYNFEKRSPKYHLPSTWNFASKYYNIKMLKKPQTLASNYKEYIMTIYKYFECNLPKCYICSRGK